MQLDKNEFIRDIGPCDPTAGEQPAPVHDGGAARAQLDAPQRPSLEHSSSFITASAPPLSHPHVRRLAFKPVMPALLHPHTLLHARAPLLRTSSSARARATHWAPSARAPSTRAHARASGTTVKIRPICNSSLILKFPFTPRIYFTTQSDCEVSSKVTVGCAQGERGVRSTSNALRSLFDLRYNSGARPPAPPHRPAQSPMHRSGCPRIPKMHEPRRTTPGSSNAIVSISVVCRRSGR